MSRTNTYLRQLPPGLTHIDVYWVLRLFNVTDPCAQHAVKKLLADGSGDKDRAENMREAWETLDRWVEMESESTHKDLRQHRPDGWTRWIEERRRLYEAMDPCVQPERQDQVRERHDVVPDDALNRPVPAGWRPIATAPTDGTEVEVLTDEVGDLRRIRAIASYHPDAGWTVDEIRPTLYWRPLDDQRPPDRPLASHCPDGGACKHKCGLEPCKEPRKEPSE